MIEVYIDGASKGSPGPSGAGIFINEDGNIDRYSIPLPDMDNHEAEYWALIKALEICIERRYHTVSFRTDSQLVLNAVENQFVKKDKFKPLLAQTLELINQFPLFFIKWIPEKQNKSADALARKAIRLPR